MALGMSTRMSLRAPARASASSARRVARPTAIVARIDRSVERDAASMSSPVSSGGFVPTPVSSSKRSSFVVRASPDGEAAKKAGEKNEESGSNIRQLLGIRGGEQTTDIWKIRLQLTKPVTWVPLIWGVLCGAAASGHFTWTFENVGKSMLCMFMSGPLLTGYTQTINDWYDREIDAINEPNRPIPSGAISEFDVQVQMYALLLGGWAAAWTLDQWCEHD